MDPRSLSERESSSDALTPGSEPCPKCGVLVAPGYPKCPRCKAVLVAPTISRDKAAGGTSVIGRTVPWTIVVIAALLTGIIYYLAERDPKSAVDQGESSESAAPENDDTPAQGADEEAAADEIPEDQGAPAPEDETEQNLGE